MSLPFVDAAAAAAYPFVTALATSLTSFGGAATAIVVCTVVLRLAMLPLTVAAVRTRRAAPLTGCLPLLLQAPFFLVWYRIFTAPTIAGHANALLAYRFLGAPLSVRLLVGGYPLAFLPLFVALLGLAVLAMWQVRRAASASGTVVPRAVLALPFASLASVFVLPLVALVYLVTTRAWTAAENAVLPRRVRGHDG
jgi:YidC/Oxa1 family membrane protein insertase